MADTILFWAPSRCTYIITSRGIIRLYERGVKIQHDYYSKQFPPATFFPDRDYFKETITTLHAALSSAVDGESKNSHLEKYFHLTPAYVDLGGNGLVLTACRQMHVQFDRDSALCLDFPLAEAAKAQVRQRLTQLKGPRGHISDITCTAVTANPQDRNDVVKMKAASCSGAPPAATLYLENEISELLGKSSLSDLFGKIEFHEKLSSDRFVFTVPLNQQFTESDATKRTASLVYCEFDLKGLGLMAAAPYAALFCVISFVMALSFVFGDYKRRLEVQNRTLDRVSLVMEEAKDAYCRLDGDQQLIYCNKAFARLLGYSTRDAVLNLSFWELLADADSKSQYELVCKYRRRGDNISAYDLNLKGAVGQIPLRVKVYGAAVPLPLLAMASDPQTFGLIIQLA